jgi:hypothetical protein
MSQPCRKSELVLVIAFLALIGAVPVAQTCLDVARGERVQATDVFRLKPTAKNLRRFEETLEQKSWFQQQLQPAIRRFFFAALRDPGAKGVLGRDTWLFYRPDVRYLLDRDQPSPDLGNSKWVHPGTADTALQSVERAIRCFRDQLQERGISLVVIPVPVKPGIYPDKVTRRMENQPEALHSPTLRLLASLRQQGVATVDLFTVFGSARTGGLGTNASAPLYLARDTHWTPLGARLAAETTAKTLRDLGLAPAGTRQLLLKSVMVQRRGDVLDMLQIPGLRDWYPPETVECEQVVDPAFGLLVPTPADRPGTFRAPGQESSVLVLGDSFCRIYQYAEPKSLGEKILTSQADPKETRSTRRLLPGSAGFISHLALALQSPVDAIVSDGGAGTDVRRKLSTNPEILEGKKVVIWEFVERDIALGRQGWEDTPLPPKLN